MNWVKQNLWVVAVALCALVCFAFTYVAFAPGFFSQDSLNQYAQARDLSYLNDWHPPILSLVWASFIKVLGITSGMLLLQLAFIWSGVLLLSLSIYRVTNSKLKSLMPFVLIGMSPFVLPLEGTIWKDVQLASSLFFVTALNLFVFTLKNTSRLVRVSSLLVSALVLVYAANLRHVEYLSVLPIIYLAGAINLKSKLHKWMYLLATSILILALPLAIGILFHPAKANVSSAVMLDDIVHLQSQVETNSSSLSPKSKQYVHDIRVGCDQSRQRTNYLFVCGVSDTRFLEMSMYDYQAVKKTWIQAILHRPLTYIKYRLTNFGSFLSPSYIYAYHAERVNPNSFGIPRPNNAITRSVEGYFNYALRDFGFGFRPYFWASLSIIGLWVSWRLRSRVRMHTAIILIYASGLVHLLSFIPMTIANDYRYTYWLTISSLTATILLTVTLKNEGKIRINGKRRV